MAGSLVVVPDDPLVPGGPWRQPRRPEPECSAVPWAGSSFDPFGPEADGPGLEGGWVVVVWARARWGTKTATPLGPRGRRPCAPGTLDGRVRRVGQGRGQEPDGLRRCPRLRRPP